jgi:hypothetical protein
MYIPISYWQTAGGDSNANAYYWRTNVVPFTYVFDGITISGSTSGSSFVTPTCIDLKNISSIVTGTNFMEPAGGLFFCSAELSGSSQCCINTPPKTGPEAWYIDVIYRISSDIGILYYNYINQFGNIVNDTISFGQTKRIVSQVAPLFFRKESNFYNGFMDFNVVEKFTGQVIEYPYRNVPADYTIELKRTSPYILFTNFPEIGYTIPSSSNGFPISSNLGGIEGGYSSSVGSTITVSSAMPPIDNNSINNSAPGQIWITNVTPKPKGALQLTSCTSTHSLWVTLNNYNYYNTGSVLKTNTPALTTTASCWTVNALTSSLSTSVALTNVDILASYATCFTCISGTGSITSSLSVDYLLLAGGGGGGAGNGGNGPGAGGGAGGLLSGSYTLQPSTTYPVTIGLGGAGGTTNSANGINGGNSSVFSLTAIGGGAGAGNQKTGSAGGSGGGTGASATPISGGLGTPGQGNNGGPGGGGNLYAGGGGGGASSAGTVWIFNPGPGYLSFAGSGGSGSQWLDGNYYGGGGSGGGGNSFGINPGTPGIGGGGTGGDEQFNILATSGQANRGAGGGGGASFSPIIAGSGSAGIVILRYPGTTQLIGGGTVSVSGSYVYHTFTSSANIST